MYPLIAVYQRNQPWQREYLMVFSFLIHWLAGCHVRVLCLLIETRGKSWLIAKFVIRNQAFLDVHSLSDSSLPSYPCQFTLSFHLTSPFPVLSLTQLFTLTHPPSDRLSFFQEIVPSLFAPSQLSLKCIPERLYKWNVAVY